VEQPDQNQVTWVTAPASGTHLLSGFEVVKNGTTLTPALPVSQFAFTDPIIVCNTSYQYQIVGNYSGGARSLSYPKSVTAISSGPPALLNISSIVTDPGVELSWIPDPAYPVKEYQIIKSINGNYSPLTTTTEPAYTDPAYVTAANSCYRITYTDQCDNPSPSSLDACPIQLTGGLQADNVINLNWSEYVGWTSGVSSYTLEKYDEQGTLLSSTDVGTATTYTDATEDLINQVYQYRIVATANEAGVTLSSSNWLVVIKEPNIFYPTAFTPNNDGLNDTFNVYGQYIAKFEMKIFNRWGEMMYATDDLGNNGWDGTFRGNLMPEGTYVFTAQITDLAQRTFDRSGSVLLLRKK
jgi:gliding motility-associated-like protein